MSSYPVSTLRLLLVMAVAILLIFSVFAPIRAADIRGDDTVTIGKDEIIDDDLLVAGNTIVVDGMINGDLVAAGSQVTINGHVKGSLIFAGQSLLLNGKVDGTVYSAAGSLSVGSNAHIERNLMFGGYSLRADSGSVVGRDVFVGGYQAVLNGEVTRNLYASLAALELNGHTGGDVKAVVDQPGSNADMVSFTGFGGQAMPPTLQPGLRVGSEASIGGKFSYTSPIEQTNTIAATPEGGILYTASQPGDTGTAEPTRASLAAVWFMSRLREFVSLFVLGALALWLLPTLFSRIEEPTLSQTALAGAWGVLVSIVGYGGAIFITVLLIAATTALAGLTLAGLATSVFALGFSSLGFAITIFSILVAYVSKLVVVYPLMYQILKKSLPAWTQYRVVPLALGILLFVLLSSIPLIGILIRMIVTLIGLGSMWMVVRDSSTRTKTATPQLVLSPA